jgi:hypothetical protein
VAPSDSTIRVQQDAQWTCNTCTFAGNPQWKNVCEICYAGRNKSAATGIQVINSSVADVPKMDNKSVGIYSNSFNDKAQNWNCTYCPQKYINLKKDTECALCKMPRSFSNHSSDVAKQKAEISQVLQPEVIEHSHTKNKQSDSSEKKNCIICYDAPIECAISPCGHMCICSKWYFEINFISSQIFRINFVKFPLIFKLEEFRFFKQYSKKSPRKMSDLSSKNQRCNSRLFSRIMAICILMS